jgi:hypothetical protein
LLPSLKTSFIDLEEAEMLIDGGVGYLGFPLVLGYHREDLSVDEAAAIAAKLRDRATFFLITYLNTAPPGAALVIGNLRFGPPVAIAVDHPLNIFRPFVDPLTLLSEASMN